MRLSDTTKLHLHASCYTIGSNCYNLRSVYQQLDVICVDFICYFITSKYIFVLFSHVNYCMRRSRMTKLRYYAIYIIRRMKCLNLRSMHQQLDAVGSHNNCRFIVYKHLER